LLSPSESKAPLTRLASVVENYIDERTRGKVVDYVDYSHLQERLSSLTIKEGAESWDSIWTVVDSYLAHSVKTAHPQYFNQLWGGQSTPALVGSVIESLANTSMYTYEVAPVATLIETEVLQRFKHVFGFLEGEAQVTTGGSNSNYLALLLALHQRFPEVKKQGVVGLPPVTVFVSDQAHYSMDKAMVMAGLGLDALVKVPSDDTGKIKLSELEKLLVQCVSEGRIPVSIIGTAGTTVRGAFDDFNGLAKLASKFSCWFHIDGAWGGAVAFSKTERKWLEGCERADSLSWDGHKMLGVPLMCGVLFVRESGHFDRVCNLGDTSYIFHEAAERQDLGPYSMQCGRRVDMFKMWLEYVFYGEKGFENRIDRFMALSSVAEARIKAEPSLELQSERCINNICFRSLPTVDVDLTVFNKRVREKLYHSGKSLVNMAYLGEDMTVRLIICNKDIGEEDVNTFFDNWLAMADATEQEFA
jgi:glutamate/tyrosine decarboxylase-like PLP-dependent enzyme